MAGAAAKAQEAKAPDAPDAEAPDAETRKAGTLSTKAILAAINDDADDPDTVKALNTALYNFGAQDPSLALPRSWQRVQRRIGVDPDKLDGIATAEQVAVFADRVGLAVSK
jgi:hypothetical protein